MLATKVSGSMGEDPNRGGCSRRWIVTEVENSLRRLRTDHIDLYQIHRPDPHTDIEETLSALTDLVRVGKVRAIGSSNTPASEIVEAQRAADRHGLQRFRTERMNWVPRHLTDERELDAVERLIPLAQEAGVSLTHLAMAFAITHPGVTSAIIGPRTMEHLEDLLAGATVALDDEVLDRIDQIVAPGTDIGPLDVSHTPPSITDRELRRRAPGERGAVRPACSASVQQFVHLVGRGTVHGWSTRPGG